MSTSNRTHANFLRVEVDGHHILIPTEQIREILGDCMTVTVAHESEHLKAVFLWNGRAVPLLSLGHLPRRRGTEPVDTETFRRRTLIFEALGEVAGVSVDDASEIFSVPDERLKAVRIEHLPFAQFEVDDESNETVMTVVDLSQLMARALQISAASGSAEQPQD